MAAADSQNASHPTLIATPEDPQDIDESKDRNRNEILGSKLKPDVGSF